MQATYSPDDNKLRLYSTNRLDRDLYDRVKSAGFKWAPKQELFVAPMWTPAREDLLIELCGEIDDEDKTLVERAEERSERFEDYSDKRANDAASAHKAVKGIMDHIPLGQPILVGHHSERRARKDAERIDNGIRRAVKMWETSEYWTRRAAGAISNAKYKERVDVRARRIKGIEADKRKQEKYKREAENSLTLWSKEGLTLAQGIAIAGGYNNNLHLPRKAGDREDWNIPASAYNTLQGEYSNLYAPRTLEEVVTHAKRYYPRVIANCNRWIAHYENRLAYEKAMMEEQGGLAADKFDIKPGGRVLVRGEWMIVIRVNKTGGRISSVTTNCRYVSVRSIEEVKDYMEPTDEEAAKVEKVTKLAPLVNYPGEGFIEMTNAEWKKKPADYRIIRRAKETAEHGAHRYRVAFIPGGSYRQAQVYITDAKKVDMPAPEGAAPIKFDVIREISAPPAPRVETPVNETLEAMRDHLKFGGVKVVSAPQLFPTPAHLAKRMVSIANPLIGERVLEPSAGTGRILEALPRTVCDVVAVELNHSLAAILKSSSLAAEVLQADFLQCNGDLGKFDAVIMNPPFENGVDIKHITHALHMVKPGGRLVAICANGPRQNAQLRPLVESMGGNWEVLPTGTFEESGTGVNTVLLSLSVPVMADNNTEMLEF